MRHALDWLVYLVACVLVALCVLVLALRVHLLPGWDEEFWGWWPE
jgi:hypothetical protein